MLKANCPIIVKRSDLAACVQRNIAHLKDKRANPPADWVHEGSDANVCVVCQEVFAGADFWGEDYEEEDWMQPHRCDACDAFFCNLCAPIAREKCPSCETAGDAVQVKPCRLECKCQGHRRKMPIPEGHVLAVQPVIFPREQLKSVLEANESYLHRKKQHVEDWTYRDDSEFCIVCLEYLWTDTPDVDCVHADCGFVYCIPCVRALGLKLDEYGDFAGDTCPTCDLGVDLVV